MSLLQNIPTLWGSSEVDSRQKSVSDKKDSISNAVPLCLPNNYTWDPFTKKISVDKTNTRKSLTVCTEGLELLKSLKDQLVVVLCIAGPARSGKSFFASQLLEDVNFDVGHGAGSHTTGIWIGVGAKPISWSSDKARVVILDAEGLGGVNADCSNTDAKWEHKIFSLCVLLSSYVIYNSKGPPNNDELDKLGFIAEFSRSICPERQDDVEEQKTPSEGLGQFGPDFLWLFRDNLCTPDLDGQPCDWTKFVKKALLDPKPNEPERNHIRKSISSTFRTIQAADIPPPTFDPKAVKNLLGEENKYKINKKFLLRIEEVAQNMLSSVQVKNIKGSKLTGSQLIDMLFHVVDSVNSEYDKFDVTSMWDGIVNTQMQRYIQSALDLYKKEMVKPALPEEEETYLKLHETAKDSSKVHFEKVTKRFDKDIRSNQLQIMCHKIETEFNDSFLKKNEQASLSFNDKLNTDLEKKYFHNLPAKPSCVELKTADKKVNDGYKEQAKGPKANQVKSETQLQRGQQISRMRTESLIYAKQQSCELFEKSLREALEGEPHTLRKLNALKETCSNYSFSTFRKTTCNDVDCTPCMEFKQSVGQTVESIFKTCLSECYDKSKEACQSLINELMKTKLLQFLENIDSHNYSDFSKIKAEILAQYCIEAKGLAKVDLMGTCSETIDMQKEGIQLLIIQSALKSVSCEYTKSLNQTAKSDPCEAEELDKMLALKRGNMISAFKVKCEGIDESKLEPYQLNLQDLIKNFTTWIANENTLRSINLCEDLVTRLSKEFHDGILKTQIPLILCETEHSKCSDHVKKAEKFKDKILNDYEKKARGPEKERFQQSLNKYIELHLIIVKKVANEMILNRVLVNHFDQLDIVKKKFPISESELQSAISETNKNTKKVFIDAPKQISLPFGSCSKDMLTIVLNFDVRQLVEENYKESMGQLDSICKRISLESRKKCEELVDGGEADTVKFAKMRKKFTEEFDKCGRGVLKDHYRDILQGNIDMELRFAHTTIGDKRVKLIFADCRTAIENMVQGNPLEQDDLENDIERIKKDARREIEMLQKEDAETNITVTEETLTIELKDTISYVVGKNLHISSQTCNAQLREVMEALKSRCKTFLDNEKSTVEILNNIKTECLGEYKNRAIGPAKETVKGALEKEIDEEIQRTYVLFAKTNYLKILRVQTEAFKYEDQVKTSVEVNLDELTKLLEEESKDILLRYPGLIGKIKNDLSKDLRKEREFYLKVLNQKITLTSEVPNYRSSIAALIKDGPSEEEHLTQQIDKKRKEAWERIENTFKEVEQKDFALTKAMLEKALEDTTRNIETQNHILSTAYCNSHRLQVSEQLKGYCKSYLVSEQSVIDNVHHLKDEYLRKYDEVAIGPAKAKEKKTLEKEIVEEVDRTFVLLATAKYGKILREDIEQFPFRRLLNKPDPESKGKLVERLRKKVDNILNTYPTLEETAKNDLTRDLEESIIPSLLKELKTVYKKAIDHLKGHDILEENELKDAIKTAKGLFDIKINGNDYDVPEELQTFIDKLERNLEQDNLERSRINCQKTLDLLFQYDWDHLKKEYFKKIYEEKCQGPAKQTVWEENKERVEKYYNSYPAMFRKMKFWKWF